jgi:hypothetical protein
MKRIVSLLLSLVLFACLAPAQQRPMKGMKGMGMMMPNYDPAKEVTVTGTVEEVVQQPAQGRMPMGGVHLMLKTADKTVEVHVGPNFFLNEKKVTFAKGDQVQVIGAEFEQNGTKGIIAREIKRGDTTLTLRDEKGIPKWSRMGAKQ